MIENDSTKNPLNMLHSGLLVGNRYVLNERIAVGGMGEVWKAHDENLNKPVAIKILRPELAGQKLFLSRLEYESKNARQVRHPNLAHIFNSGEQDGLGWIAMEMVVGEPLTTILEKHPVVEPKFILSVLYQACGALAAVHKAGIIHRDIKPGNILITKEGVVKLSDFGISKAVDQVTLTAEGMVMGTAQYLSPEQAIGKPASAAGDLYALGVITYEALIGNRPFTGEKPVDIAFAHVNSPIPVLPASVPEPLQRLIRKLLQKDPRERWNDAELLQKEIVKIWYEVNQIPYHEWADTGIQPVPPPTDKPVAKQPVGFSGGTQHNSQPENPRQPQGIRERRPDSQIITKAPTPTERSWDSNPPVFPPDPNTKQRRLEKRHDLYRNYSFYQAVKGQDITPFASPIAAEREYYPAAPKTGSPPPAGSDAMGKRWDHLQTLAWRPRHAVKSGYSQWIYAVALAIILLILELLALSYYGVFSGLAISFEPENYSVWITNLKIE